MQTLRSFLAVAFLIISQTFACHCFSAEKQKPNIIFINADDLGYGDLSCYGQKYFSTPNIDQLALQGIRFTQCYAGCTVCAPSRCALLTGYHSGHGTVRGNGTGKRSILSAQDVTVAEVLKKAGYATGMFGKWGLGELDSTGAPKKKGFDEFFGYLDHVEAHVYYPAYLWNNEGKVPLDKATYSHDLIVSNAFAFVRRHKSEPFFLYLAVTLPHAGMEVPEDSYQPFLGRFPEKKYDSHQSLYATTDHPLAAFAGMVTRLDRDVGRLLSLLKDLQIDEKTIVFFSSDNGPHREGGANPEFFNSNGGLRGIKRDLYEGGIRVPMIVRWPKHIKAARISEQVWAQWDFLPTAAEIARVTSPKGLDGISMLAALLGRRQKNHQFLYWEFHERGFEQAVRMGSWKAIRHEPAEPLEIYNLGTDLREERNVARQNPKVVAKIENYLKTARTPSADWPIKDKDKAAIK
jgi:arylsulfatase A-like enzyme